MITVLGAPPSRALRVVWMLEEMALPYEVRHIDFADLRRDEGLRAASPAGTVPALLDGDVGLSESVAIMEYLGARHGPTPLVPAARDPAFPAYQQWLHFGEASLAAPLNIAVASRFFAPEADKANWGAKVALRLAARRCEVMAARLERSPHLAGEAFTAADISCAYGVELLRKLGEGDRLPAPVMAWWDRITARPAHARALRHHNDKAVPG